MNQRRKFLVNPAFQLRFIGWMSGVAITVILVFYTAHLYFFRTYLLKGREAGLPADHIFFTFLSDQYRDMNWIFIITAVVVFSVTFFIGLMLSHRIVGPLDRLSTHMNNSWEQKSISEFQFRSEDYFQELGEAYNRHLGLLREAQIEAKKANADKTR